MPWNPFKSKKDKKDKSGALSHSRSLHIAFARGCLSLSLECAAILRESVQSN